MIQRFEDEYPETRIAPEPAQMPPLQGSADGPHDLTMASENSTTCANADGEMAIEDEDVDQYAVRLSRRASNTSLHSRAMTSEEGHIHRLSQNLRRDLLDPALEQREDPLARSSDDPTVAALREKVEQLRGDEIRSCVERVGPEQAFKDLSSTVKELWMMQKQDAEGFQEFKESQIAAQINAGIIPNTDNTPE
jgi:hypothetical protein